jgi:hypothetical protein
MGDYMGYGVSVLGGTWGKGPYEDDSKIILGLSYTFPLRCTDRTANGAMKQIAEEEIKGYVVLNI